MARWTEKDVATLRAMRAEDRTFAEIAIAVARNEPAVWSKAKTLGLTEAPVSVWTEEMRAIAVGLKRAGVPAKSIAVRLGVSPSSVRHMARRLGAYSRLNKQPGRILNPGMRTY